MDFKISDELESMRKMAYDFAVKNIKPTMEEDEKEHKYRPEMFKKMGDQGMFGCLAPEKFGGLGPRRSQYGGNSYGNRSSPG
jgi:glutaryl-CoA dehydrogenase (non-decarboxylating)